MLKAVFMDYTGTTVQERGEDIEHAVAYICRHSDLKDPKDVLAQWWGRVKTYESESYGEKYRTEDEIVDCILKELQDEFHLTGDLSKIHRFVQGFWVNAPLFPDVKPFFERCPVPVYLLTNDGESYVKQALEQNGLSPAGVVCADSVRAYKPHKELFFKALERSGAAADEVVHIGDSYTSDVCGAREAGIRPILVQRTPGKAYPGVLCVRSLADIDFSAL